MSVTTTIPDLVKSEGGIPTAAELETAWTALADVEQEVLDRLIHRTSAVLIAAYEQPASDKPEVEVDGQLVAEWLYWTTCIAETCEVLVEKTGKLRELTNTLSDVAHSRGKIEFEPPFNAYGGRPYEPSREALVRWGLVEPNEGDDAS